VSRLSARACAATLVLGALARVTSDARAATPEEAPQESRDQVAVALRALAPAYKASARSVAAGSPGTIEDAIGRFAPAKYHPVDEGSLPPERPGASCPSDMALVFNRFCVDKYEGSIVEKTADGTLVDHPAHETLLAGHVYLARSKAGVLPQAYISASQAQAACKASGKRLCHPVEWRAACGGSQGYAFPYGPKRSAGTCHDSGVAPMLVFHADTLKKGWGPLELNDPRLNQLAGTVAKTGAFPGCVNDFGVYDMVGNVHEWTADPNGTFQGGFWLDTAQHGDGCAYRTIAHPYDYHDYSTGFRCCLDL
jgi:hypothetical protein